MSHHHRPFRGRLALGLTVAALLVTAGCGSSSSGADSSSGDTSAGTPTTVAGTLPATTTTVAPKPVPAGFRPVSASFTSAMDGYVLGYAPCGSALCTYLVRSADGTKTWSLAGEVPLPESGPAGGSFQVRFADRTNGWVFGMSLWATHDSGATWTKIGDRQIHGLAAASGRLTVLEADCAGSCDTAILRTSAASSDDLQTLGDPIKYTGNGGFALAVSTSHVAVQAGSDIHTGSAGQPLTTTSTPCTGKDSMPTAIATIGATNLSVVCISDPGAGSSSKQVRSSNDDGATWADRGPAAPRSGQVGSLTVSPDNATVLIGASSGATSIFRLADGAWTTPLTDTEHGGAFLTDLGFTTVNQAIAVEPGAAMLVTHDAGATWAPVVFG